MQDVPTYEILDEVKQTEPYYSACLLCDLVAHLGYTPEDLAHTYYLKTDENLRRWKAAAEAHNDA